LLVSNQEKLLLFVAVFRRVVSFLRAAGGVAIATAQVMNPSQRPVAIHSVDRRNIYGRL